MREETCAVRRVKGEQTFNQGSRAHVGGILGDIFSANKVTLAYVLLWLRLSLPDLAEREGTTHLVSREERK